MTYETPRDGAGAKACAWCGGPIKQSGVGRSRDYCSRTHKEYAYRSRRDAKLIAQALADARPVSTTAETGPAVSPVVETGSGQVAAPIPAPAEPEPDDYLLPPPAPVPETAVSPDEVPTARKAPAPRARSRRPLSDRGIQDELWQAIGRATNT
ncbi:hypothetical protein ACWCWQ_37160 [Streptomyces sp. NPDC001571]